MAITAGGRAEEETAANRAPESEGVGCLFCGSIHPLAPSSAFLVYEDEHVAVSHVFNGNNPMYLGHLVLQSKRHARGFAELSDVEAAAVGVALRRVSKALKECTGAENVYAIFFAEIVRHLHVLITARYPELPEEYWRTNILAWPDAPRGEGEAVESLCRRIRSEMG